MNKIALLLVLNTIAGIGFAENFESLASDVQQSNDYNLQRRIKIYQRTSAVINIIPTRHGTSKTLNISVGDITHNQVLTTVSHHSNGDVYKTVSLRQGDVIKFTLRNVRYRVKLVYMLNKPIGSDYAIFKVEQSR